MSLPQIQPQPFGRVLKTMLTQPPLNFDLLGALFFIVYLVTTPGNLFFSLVLAALFGYLIYANIRAANLYAALRARMKNGEELSDVEQALFKKPKAGAVLLQAPRGFMGILFIFAFILNIGTLLGTAGAGSVTALMITGGIAVAVTYLCFILSNGYNRAKVNLLRDMVKNKNNTEDDSQPPVS
jgi:hypothetical protein